MCTLQLLRQLISRSSCCHAHEGMAAMLSLTVVGLTQAVWRTMWSGTSKRYATCCLRTPQHSHAHIEQCQTGVSSTCVAVQPLLRWAACTACVGCHAWADLLGSRCAGDHPAGGLPALWGCHVRPLMPLAGCSQLQAAGSKLLYQPTCTGRCACAPCCFVGSDMCMLCLVMAL